MMETTEMGPETVVVKNGSNDVIRDTKIMMERR